MKIINQVKTILSSCLLSVAFLHSVPIINLSILIEFYCVWEDILIAIGIRAARLQLGVRD